VNSNWLAGSNSHERCRTFEGRTCKCGIRVREPIGQDIIVSNRVLRASHPSPSAPVAHGPAITAKYRWQVNDSGEVILLHDQLSAFIKYSLQIDRQLYDGARTPLKAGGHSETLYTFTVLFIEPLSFFFRLSHFVCHAWIIWNDDHTYYRERVLLGVLPKTKGSKSLVSNRMN
jgi:hypothetical protein